MDVLNIEFVESVSSSFSSRISDTCGTWDPSVVSSSSSFSSSSSSSPFPFLFWWSCCLRLPCNSSAICLCLRFFRLFISILSLSWKREGIFVVRGWDVGKDCCGESNNVQSGLSFSNFITLIEEGMVTFRHTIPKFSGRRERSRDFLISMYSRSEQQSLTVGLVCVMSIVFEKKSSFGSGGHGKRFSTFGRLTVPDWKEEGKCFKRVWKCSDTGEWTLIGRCE